eukprot:6175609-Pleurochrysis_carterae.AAC.2
MTALICRPGFHLPIGTSLLNAPCKLATAAVGVCLVHLIVAKKHTNGESASDNEVRLSAAAHHGEGSADVTPAQPATFPPPPRDDVEGFMAPQRRASLTKEMWMPSCRAVRTSSARELPCSPVNVSYARWSSTANTHVGQYTRFGHFEDCAEIPCMTLTWGFA